jgi:hypothetical protein
MKYQIIIAVFAPILASLYGQIPPVAGTFRCDDPSIQFPYQGDTVSATLLFQAILIPIILVVRYHRFNKKLRAQHSRSSLLKPPYSIRSEFSLPPRKQQKLQLMCTSGDCGK